MKENIPVINIATACEKVLVEKDDVLSLLRIVDTFYIPDQMSALPNAVVSVSALIVVRGGDLIGDGKLQLDIEKPDGSKTDRQEFPLTFPTANHANNVICNFAVALTNIGTSWVNVLWNGSFLTKFPVKLERQPKPEGQS